MQPAFRNFVPFRIFMTVSVKNILTIAIAAVTLTACGKEEKELSPVEINAKADSIVRNKVEKMRREAKEDLDRRLPIELKPKVDSIRNNNNKAIDPVPVFPGSDDNEDAADDPSLEPDTAKNSKK